jgi:AcrR family transcriptional regulator
MPAKRPARSLRTVDTRQRLVQAATELFERRGYHKTTVEEIAKKSGVAKATFFVHFSTKEAIVDELVATQVKAARQARTRVLEAGGSPVDALRAAVLELGQQTGASRSLCRAVLAATLEDSRASDPTDEPFGELTADLVADATAAQRAGLLDAHPYGSAIARALLIGYLGTAFYFSHSLDPSLVEVLRPVVEATLDGFRKQEGRHTPRSRDRQPARRRRA